MSSRSSEISFVFFHSYSYTRIGNQPKKPLTVKTKPPAGSYDIIKSPAVPPPLLVPLSVSVPLPRSLPLSITAWSSTLALPLALAFASAAHHCLRPPQEVIYTHVVVMLHDGRQKSVTTDIDMITHIVAINSSV